MLAASFSLLCQDKAASAVLSYRLWGGQSMSDSVFIHVSRYTITVMCFDHVEK